MNIGIITHPLHSNFGGILQNYAMQEVLRRMEHVPITYRFSISLTFVDWININLRVLLKKLLGKNVQFRESPWNYKKRMQGLEHFIERNIKCYPSNNSKENLNDFIVDNSLSALIVGSDQVWRPKYVKNIYNMFLDFAEDKNIIRISYAASFGTDSWEFDHDQQKRCSELLEKFNNVSVREQSAVKICESRFHRKAKWVLDPTLLLSKNDYNCLCVSIPPSTEKYILAYFLDTNDAKLSYLSKMSQLLNLKIRVQPSGIDIKEHDTIDNWLSNFRDASFVITDSYHGTIFSIIYNKEFRTFYNYSRGNARMDSILTFFSNKVNFISENDMSYDVTGVDWEYVNNNIEELRQSSFDFLRDSIS